MPKIIDNVEFTETESGWTSRKVHDEGAFVMERGNVQEVEADIKEIEAGRRPGWTLLGLPRIVVNGEVFRERDQV